jgi:hypothetical protein
MTEETIPTAAPAVATQAVPATTPTTTAEQAPMPVVIVDPQTRSPNDPAIYSLSTDPEHVEQRKITVDANTINLAHIVDIEPVEAMISRIRGEDGKGTALHESQVAGLLEVERSGKNRTDTVKALCDHLGIKSPYEVTAAGPAFTNDVTAVTKL